MWKIFNDIKSGYHHNKKYIKITIFKKDLNIIKIFIKLNIVKKIYKYNVNKYIVEFNYENNKKIFLIQNIFKPSQKKTIKLKTLKNTFHKKNNLLILSTNKGVITSYEAVKYKIGGLLLSKILI